MNDGGTAARGGNGASAPERDLCARGAAPGLETTDAELTEYGVRNCRIRPLPGGNEYHLRINEFVLPNFIAFPGNAGTYGINWHVPIDDTHHWKWTWTFDRENPLDQETIRKQHTELTADYRSVRNKANRYLQDRASMKRETFTGIGYNFDAQDLCVIEAPDRFKTAPRNI